jgi:sugar/nucleoside kinase (ribokinase family)
LARIAVLGSVALDEVVRLEGPLHRGAHLESRQSQMRLGGGGANVAIPLARAGHRVSLVSCVGEDRAGERLLDELRAAGVDVTPVIRVAGPTTRSLVVVEPSGERTVVNVHRARESGPPMRLRDLETDFVYVRSRAGNLAPLLAEKARDGRVVAHMPPCQEGSRPAQILVASAPDLEPAALRQPWRLAQRVSGGLVEWAILTRGPRLVLASSARRRIRARPARVRAVDTTGAGDAFAAGLIHALASGAGMPAALRAAARWGTACVAYDSSVLPPEAVLRLTTPRSRRRRC